MKTRSHKTFSPRKGKDRVTKSKKSSPPRKIKVQTSPTRVTRHSKTCFTDLNNDCIEEILRRLPAVELCKFTVLSKRLKSIAEEMFKRLYSLKTITFKPTETCATEFGSKITRQVHNCFSILFFPKCKFNLEKANKSRMIWCKFSDYLCSHLVRLCSKFK